jgi:hypothetical protein
MSVSMLIALFRAFLVLVTALVPHTKGRLLAVRPNMAEVLAVAILRETSLGFVRLWLVAIWQRFMSLKILWNSDILVKVIIKRRMFLWLFLLRVIYGW